VPQDSSFTALILVLKITQLLSQSCPGLGCCTHCLGPITAVSLSVRLSVRLSGLIILSSHQLVNHSVKKCRVSDVYSVHYGSRLITSINNVEIVSSFCLSVCRLFSHSVNQRTRKRTSTKLGRHGQGVTLYK